MTSPIFLCPVLKAGHFCTRSYRDILFSMKKVIVGIGIPGSGKTRVLKAFAEKNGYEYICPDDLRQELTGDAKDQSRNPEVWSIAKKQLKNLLEQNESVVFDATFVDSEQRKDFLFFARSSGADKIQGVFMDIPFEVAKERNEKRERIVPEQEMERMNALLHGAPPEITDGFDSLFVLNQSGELVRAEAKGKEGVIEKEFNQIH